MSPERLDGSSRIIPKHGTNFKWGNTMIGHIKASKCSVPSWCVGSESNRRIEYGNGTRALSREKGKWKNLCGYAGTVGTFSSLGSRADHFLTLGNVILSPQYLGGARSEHLQKRKL